MPSIPSPNQPGHKFAVALGLFLMACSLYGVAEVFDLTAGVQEVLDGEGLRLDELTGAGAVHYAKAKWMYKLSFFATIAGFASFGGGVVRWIVVAPND